MFCKFSVIFYTRLSAKKARLKLETSPTPTEFVLLALAEGEFMVGTVVAWFVFENLSQKRS